MTPEERSEPGKRLETERTPAMNALPIDLSPEEARDLLKVLADRFSGQGNWAPRFFAAAYLSTPDECTQFANILVNGVVRAIALAAVRRNEWRLIHEAYRDQYRCHVCGERSFAGLATPVDNLGDGASDNAAPFVFCGPHAAERGCRL